MSILKRANTLFIYLLFVFSVFKPYNIAYMDAPHSWQVGFQDPATPIMEGIISFNGLLMTFMLLIACFVGWLLYKSLTLFNESVNPEPASFNHSTLLEIVWTIVPAGILMIISIPSYNLLYAMEEVIDPSLTIKVVGHQWYWSYEYSDFELVPRVAKENLDLVQKRVKNLKDWLDYIENSKEDQNLQKTQGSFDSEMHKDKLYIADAELGDLKAEWVNAKKELYEAGLYLNSAKSDFKLARLDLAASRLNKSSAEVIKARTELSEFSSSFKRPNILLKDGFDGWDEKLRLKTKENLDILKARLLKAEQEFEADSSIFDILSIGLNPEDLTSTNTETKSAELEFNSLGDKLAVPFLRSDEAVEILNRANIKLKYAQSFFDSTRKTLEKAVLTFDELKDHFSKKDIEFLGYLGLKGNFNVGILDFINTDSNDYNSGLVSKTSLERLYFAKDELCRAKSQVSKISEELSKINNRLEIAGGHAKDVNKSLTDTRFVEHREEITRLKVSETYFDNFTWDRHKTDLLEYENKLRYGKFALEEAKKIMDETLLYFYNSIEKTIEADLENNKMSLLFSRGMDSPALDLGGVRDKKNILGLEDCILKGAGKKLLSGGKVGDLLIDKISSDLERLNFEQDVKQLKSKFINEFNDEAIYTQYIDFSVNKLKRVVDIAEIDYNELICTSTEVKTFIKKIESQLKDVYPIKPVEELWSINVPEIFLKGNQYDVDSHVKSFKFFLSELRLLDIKANPNIIATKLRSLLLQSRADLENLKLFSAFLEKAVKENNSKIDRGALDLMSINSAENSLGDSLVDASSSSTGSSEGKGEGANGDGDIPKGGNGSYKDIKEVLDAFEEKHWASNQTGFLLDILQMLKDTIYTLDETDINKLRDFLYKLLTTIVEEDSSIYPILRKEINLILDLIKEPSDVEEGSERQRINFDSYLIGEDDLIIPEPHSVGKAGKVFRLLEVDNRLFVPINTHIRVLVTSADVLHSWAVPSLGIKIDACPGRLNQVFLFVKREGVFYGQCSEICGVNHGFMPIVVQAVNQDDYLTWVGKRLCS